MLLSVLSCSAQIVVISSITATASVTINLLGLVSYNNELVQMNLLAALRSISSTKASLLTYFFESVLLHCTL